MAIGGGHNTGQTLMPHFRGRYVAKDPASVQFPVVLGKILITVGGENK